MNVVHFSRERAKGNVSLPMVVWALAMTVILFMAIVAPSATVTIIGFAFTAVLGIVLGWRRRFGAVVAAPFVSWLFAWFPMEIASMIHFGVLKGFLLGLLIITFGWIGIGFIEFASLALVSLVVRSLRGAPRDEPVVIIDPERR
ncbi:MAG: hypothetical protein JWM55_1059 [Acidimicrobiaceae bacterium]|nr:hypothetical protein [Acidimicrobiaceae bacterium]